MVLDMARRGLGARKIAETLGLTRNVVLGVCFRAGVTVDKGQPKPRENVVVAPLPVERPRARGTGGGGCRFPLWADGAPPDHRYCGAPVEEAGQPYCLSHRRRCWAGAGAVAAPSIGARPPAGVDEA